MYKVVGLQYGSNIAGYRSFDLSQPNLSFDVEYDKVSELGLDLSSVEKMIQLRDYNGVLLSSTEKSTGVFSTDISDNPLQIMELFWNKALLDKRFVLRYIKGGPYYRNNLALLLTGVTVEDLMRPLESERYEVYVAVKGLQGLQVLSSAIHNDSLLKFVTDSLNTGKNVFQLSLDIPTLYSLIFYWHVPIFVLKEGVSIVGKTSSSVVSSINLHFDLLKVHSSQKVSSKLTTTIMLGSSLCRLDKIFRFNGNAYLDTNLSNVVDSLVSKLEVK